MHDTTFTLNWIELASSFEVYSVLFIVLVIRTEALSIIYIDITYLFINILLSIVEYFYYGWSVLYQPTSMIPPCAELIISNWLDDIRKKGRSLAFHWSHQVCSILKLFKLMVQFVPCLLDKNENYIDNCMYVVKSLMVTSNHKEKKTIVQIFIWMHILLVDHCRCHTGYSQWHINYWCPRSSKVSMSVCFSLLCCVLHFMSI